MREPRLTDADLRELCIRFPTHLGRPEISVLVQYAVSEIRERRAADLSDADRTTLAWIASDLISMHTPHHTSDPAVVAALDVLERLTGGWR